LWALAVAMLAVLALHAELRPLLAAGRVRTWTTVFVSLVFQATPFLMLGVAVSAGITALVPDRLLGRVLPDRPALAVPVASAAGVVLPGCECASVPVAGSLIERGAPAGAALAFLLSAPAINPIVLVATAVAFPGQPRIVVARLLASLAVSVLMGLAWSRFGRPAWLRPRTRPAVVGASRWSAYVSVAQHDLVHAGGFLVMGAAAAATLNVAVPHRWIDGFAGNPTGGVLALAVLAVLLSICSEADAFVANTFTQFSVTARLAFMVVGPAVDLRLLALQTGTFGRGFVVRFAPVTFLTAVAAAVVAGAVVA
jgi:uncharacterized membrane protein YraQ (UPF0718 family)